MQIFSKPKSLMLRLLREHIQKYPWLLSNYRGYQPLKVSDLIKRAKSYKSDHDSKITSKLLIPKSILTPRVKKLIKVIDFFTIWQDERKRNILKGNAYLGMVAIAVGKKLNISTEVISQLTPSEVLKSKDLSDIKSLKKELNERKKGTYHLMEGFKDTLITGNDYRKMREFEDVLISKHEMELIKGFVAQPGIAKGYVRICTNLKYINKFRHGEILVASMTRPEHISIMRKAKAIVTDEGGITSHAAIVSRELGIPCIIGTKIATSVLKDGDMVEVDANKGIVRKIK
jgi:phosphohistidine swiveling domain-containing protein